MLSPYISNPITISNRSSSHHMHTRLPSHILSWIFILAAPNGIAGNQPDQRHGRDHGQFTPVTPWGRLDQPSSTCPAPSWSSPVDTLPEHIPPERDDFVSFEEWKKIRQPAESPESNEPRPAPSGNASPSNASAASTTPEPVTEETKRPVNRYNYASPDCSARIHSASPLTQHASSLLHKSRDRYMLTPCKADQHWVIVELCDEIRIEAIELSLWEFYSGVIRDIRLSAAEDDDAKSWKEVAAFVGRNVRGVQTFTLPEPTSFHRFIRLDFPSYYGTEYYCPVSHLKVFGMNQMEAFKWEQRNVVEEKPVEVDDEAAKDQEEKARQSRLRRKEEAAREHELGELERLVHREAARAAPPVLPRTASSSPSVTPSPSTVDSTHPFNSTADSETHSKQHTRADSSESIYATINRRLNALEGNSSLIARYIEEQSRITRAALAALEHDWDEWRLGRDAEERGRWEQERMRQEDRLGRVISQLEQQRGLFEADRRAMTSQIRILTDELSYERRRGLAQMLILIVLVGLGVASRSSVIDAVLKPLVAEARRRKSQRDPSHGPLAGLSIDMGADRPPAIIGQPRNELVRRQWSRNTPRRPGTPVKKRNLPATLTPTARSFSSAQTEHLIHTNPRSRTSLPPQGTPFRRLAQSAHLHQVKGERSEETIVSTE